jgi:hypothetical protein
MSFQRHFLKLAGFHLACRLALMGEKPDHPAFEKSDMLGELQGMRDAAISMKILIWGKLNRPVRFVAGKGWEWV